MSETLTRLDEPGDAELISAVRAGDADAYGELFRRHVDAARRLGRQLVSGPDVDDLVSEAFAKVLTVLQHGGGPDLAFRAYLLTAVRRLHVDRLRAASRVRPTDDLTPYDPGVPFRDTAVEGFENAAAARAFASLPERWQTVLWHTEVEGQKPAEVAVLLGMSANSVSALAYRAREGLRQAFLSMHAQDADTPGCGRTRAHLGAYVRQGLSRRDAAKVESHLQECRPCAAIYLELTEANENLSALLAPLLLGGAAAAYVASAGGAVGTGGALALLGRARDAVAHHLPATAAVGVAAGAVVGAVVLATLEDDTAGNSPGGSAAPAPHRTADGRSPGAGTGSDNGDDNGNGPAVGSGDGPGPAARLSTGAAAPKATRTAPAPGGTASTGTTGEAAPSEEVPTPTGERSPSAGASGSAPAPGPGGGPESGPEPGPESGPATEPTGPSSPGATPDPSGPTQPPAPDLTVTASTTSVRGVAHISVRVTGLPAGRTGTLTVTADHTSLALDLDPRCAAVSLGSGTCTVRTTPTSFDFLAAVLDLRPTTVSFTVRPDRGSDADPSDNTTRVVLSP